MGDARRSSGSAEDDRDRAVVDELDAHPGAEDARRDRDAVAGKGGAEALESGSATSGRAASEKPGRLPFVVSASSVNWLTTRISPPRIENGQVELPVVVCEDPEPRDLAGEPVGLRPPCRPSRRRAARAARPDRADDVSVDRDARHG